MENRIRELRTQKGLSLEEFATRFSEFCTETSKPKKVSYATISRWESGINEPKLETWEKLANFFKVDRSYLQGFGWSQEEAISFCILVLVSGLHNDEGVETPDGYHFYNEEGAIKYGYDKYFLKEMVDTEDLPSFRDYAKEYLKDYKSDDIIKSDIFINDDYYKDEEELDDFIDEYLDELIDDFLTDEDRTWIKDEIVDSFKNETIDLFSLLRQLLPETDRKKIYPSEATNIQELKEDIGQKEIKRYSTYLLDNINLLKDFGFLATIGVNSWKTGITPEFEVAKELSKELQFKNFKDRQRFFAASPHKALKGTIADLDLSANDKRLLNDIFEFLITKNEELEAKLHTLTTNTKEKH